MSCKAPAFQFYAKDWLSSAKVQLMPPEYEGGYIRLLAYCWDSGDCSLPDDDEELATLSRLGQGWFNGGSKVVRRCFVPHPDKPGFLTNEKLLEQHRKLLSWREKSRAGGRKSAQQRAEKHGDLKGGSTTVPRVEQPKGNTAYCILHTANKKETSPLPPTEPARPPDDVLSEGFDPRFGGVHGFITHRLPALKRVRADEITDWLRAGADPELDIYPAVEHAISVKNGDIGSYRYFTPGILSAVTVRKERDEQRKRMEAKHG